jgi:uncharacterized damage-inducible protein DinB
MPETHALRDLLLPELEAELAITRAFMAAVPDGQDGFRPHEKSMLMARLAAHTAEMPMFAVGCLSWPDTDLAAPNNIKPHKFESSAQNLAAFDTMAAECVAVLKTTSDEKFNENWRFGIGEHTIFSGTRYNAYRTWGLNHLVHHRAQLGVYLRMLGVAVPQTYGPSADAM